MHPRHRYYHRHRSAANTFTPGLGTRVPPCHYYYQILGLYYVLPWLSSFSTLILLIVALFPLLSPHRRTLKKSSSSHLSCAGTRSSEQNKYNIRADKNSEKDRIKTRPHQKGNKPQTNERSCCWAGLFSTPAFLPPFPALLILISQRKWPSNPPTQRTPA